MVLLVEALRSFDLNSIQAQKPQKIESVSLFQMLGTREYFLHFHWCAHGTSKFHAHLPDVLLCTESNGHQKLELQSYPK